MPGQDLIDIHAHFFTPEYHQALRAAGLDSVDGFPIPDWSMDSAIELMDLWGIRTQLLSISAPGIEFAPRSAARHSANKRRRGRRLTRPLHHDPTNGGLTASVSGVDFETI